MRDVLLLALTAAAGWADAISYLALAGTILALSALRAGARVQATLWSGAGQFETTAGFGPVRSAR